MHLSKQQIGQMDDEQLIRAVEQDMLGNHLKNNIKFWLLVSAVMLAAYFAAVKLPEYVVNFVYGFMGV